MMTIDNMPKQEIDWNWFIRELKIIFWKTKINQQYTDNVENIDDMIQETIMQLLQNPKLAQTIYEEKNLNLLTRIAKRQIFKSTSRLHFSTKEAYSRYQKIIKVCKKYDIDPIPENAYKISALIEDNHHLTISLVESLLSNVQHRISENELQK